VKVRVYEPAAWGVPSRYTVEPTEDDRDRPSGKESPWLLGAVQLPSDVVAELWFTLQPTVQV